ncbi:MAG: serine/threonine protein phosphatase [Gomphosphaeria aponina SAG 52.96 = DSM 107014]|uniref:Serine/threonine protein phosphatase n=1 Tax=Gomphosphaeria aponina SAG 52.96 = DSM 107014 TaxID=1521640 RepID=A0A941GPB0_9CHRO|nr:serine/threonine protein phosphatase [Gomphosphaeria aponina SAG 52.96 = DSM 107014]
MTNRRIVIGDVHGHYDALMKLLSAIAPGSDDEIYFLGDLIDRGPQSAQVVSFVMGNNYKCLRGNHEEMLLDVLGNGDIVPEMFQIWLYNGGHATITSYEGKIPQAHIDWMQTLPIYLDLGDVWLVHAGIHPDFPIEKQTSEQFCWIRDEFHSMKKPYFPEKLIITGHTISFTLPGVKPGKIASGNGWLGIDTGVYHKSSGWLTALELNENQVYQVNSYEGNLRKMSLTEAISKIEPSLVGSKRKRRLRL